MLTVEVLSNLQDIAHGVWHACPCNLLLAIFYDAQD